MLIATTPRYDIWRFFAHNSLRNYTYVLLDRAKGQAYVIDPWEGESMLAWAKTRNIQLVSVLNTHGHHDHIRGNEVLVGHGAKLGELPEGLVSWSAPGHTMDHQVFWLAEGEHLFAGDTLFQLGVGNCKNGGDSCVLFQTMQLLKERLPLSASIHTGHDYFQKNLKFARQFDPANKMWGILPDIEESSSLPWGVECQTNPFLRVGEAVVREHLMAMLPALAGRELSDEMVFVELRKLRDQF